MNLERRSGPRAALVLVAAFSAMFTVFGVAYSFGAFFEPMAREFGSGRGSTSAIFGVTAFCYFSLGAVSGAVADRIGPRPVLLAGAAAMGGGLVLTASATSIWAGCLTYGLGVGIGTACGYVPMVAAVAGWFGRRRSLAIGLAVTGIGLGTLFVPPIAALSIAGLGWRRTYVLLGIASFVILAACAAAAAAPPAPPAGPARRGPAFSSPAFRLLYASGLLTSAALFVPFVHLVPHASRLGASPLAAASLLGVVGAASVAGRLGFGTLADRTGPVRAFQIAVGTLAMSFGVWLLADGYTGLAAFAALLGIGYGGWVALSPSVLAELLGTQGLGSRLGLLFTSAAIGALLGPPAAGGLVDLAGGYRPAIATAAVLAVAGGVLTISLPGRPRVHSS